MYELIVLVFEICCFKKAPQDLPYSKTVLYLFIAANLISGFVILMMQNNWLSALLQSLFGVLLLMAFNTLVLYVAGKLRRFYQSTSALLGVDAMIGAFALPCIATQYIGQGGLLVFVMLLALIIWHWTIIGHVLRHTLNESLPFSLGLAFLYVVSAYTLTAFLFPNLTGAS